MDNPTVRIKYTPGEIVKTEEIEVSEETPEEVKKSRKKAKK